MRARPASRGFSRGGRAQSEIEESSIQSFDRLGTSSQYPVVERNSILVAFLLKMLQRAHSPSAEGGLRGWRANYNNMASLPHISKIPCPPQADCRELQFCILTTCPERLDLSSSTGLVEGLAPYSMPIKKSQIRNR
jgi:hypothetical protein